MSEDITLIPAPEGSIETETTPTFGPIVLGSQILDGLKDGAESTQMAYPNPSAQELSSVEIVLNPITPIVGGSIQLVGSSSAYDFQFASTDTTARKILFVDIPSSFLSSFSIKNCSGDSFAAKGNYVVVSPQY